MNKKFLSLALVVVLLLTAIGGTIAYFTDTDSAINVMTMGKVDIELIEQQRTYDDKGEVTGLVNYDTENKKPLFPIVGSAQGEKDKYGLPTAENYVDKIVTVKNLEQDSYVAVYVAIPKALVLINDDPNTEAQERYYALHTNVGNNFDVNGNGGIENKVWLDDWNATYNFGSYTENGVEYIVHRLVYKDILTNKATTDTACFVGMYLDQNLDFNNTTGKYEINGVALEGVESLDLSNIEVPVFAVATQAEGFADAVTAINETFGATWTPWDK